MLINLFSKHVKLKNAEDIINYHFQLSGEHLSNDYIMDYVKKHTFDERIDYAIKVCNKSNPSKQEQFILAIAYYLKGNLYNEFAIYYINLYLSDNKFYDKYFSHCDTDIKKINYQINLFHGMLAVKYEQDLMFEKALKHALISKGFDDKLPKKFNSYRLIAEILYKMRDYKNAISNLNEGIHNTNNKYEKQELINLLNKYTDYQKNGHLYKPKNIKRNRLDIKTGTIYDLTTGEITN